MKPPPSTRLPRAMKYAASLLILLTPLCRLSAKPKSDYQKPETRVSAQYKAGPVWREMRPLETLPRGAWWSVFGDAAQDVTGEGNFHHGDTEARRRGGGIGMEMDGCGWEWVRTGAQNDRRGRRSHTI